MRYALHFILCRPANMSTSYNIFTGVFADEIGQRFLRMISSATNSAYADLYKCSMPAQYKRYVECLDRVPSWDRRVIKDEIAMVSKTYPDFSDLFKSVYIKYVKLMRGSTNAKLLVNMPRLEEFMHTYFVCASRHGFIRDALYFSRGSPLEQRVTCMDSLRDALFEYLDDVHVRLESTSNQTAPSRAGTAERLDSASSAQGDEHEEPADESASAISRQQSARRPEHDSSDATSVASEGSRRKEGRAADRSRARHEASESIFPCGASTLSAKSKVISGVFEDSDEDIQPEDSVSNIGFAEKQHSELRKLKERQPMRIEEDDARSSQTSMSLSSVSLSENGNVSQYSSREGPVVDARTSEPSATQEDARLWGRRAEVRRSPARSYVTRLTEDTVG